ncbi:MAG: cytochrome c-type biogenesis protein [Actinomycetota bacterium]
MRIRLPRGSLGAALAVILAAAVGLGAVVVASTAEPPGPLTIEERVHRIASGLRCPVCQNLSVADSPSRLAGEMREAIGDRLRAGQSPAEIRAYFVDRYGEWILLSPRGQGLGLLPWLAPAAALAVGALAVGVVLMRRRREETSPVTEIERSRIVRELAALEEPD